MTHTGKRTGKDLLAKWLRKKPRQESSSHSTDLDLPSELWARILTLDNFEVGEFVALRHVCKKWRDVVDHVGTIQHEITRTFQDDLTDLAAADREQSVPLAMAIFKFRGVFPIAHLRALHTQWSEALSTAEGVSEEVTTSVEANSQYPGRAACQLLCESLQWECVDCITIDLSAYDKLFLAFRVMESQSSTYRLPDILKTGFKRSEKLRTMALVDVHQVFFDADTAQELSSRLERLEIKAFSDISLELFIEHQHCRKLVQSVSALALKSCYALTSVQFVLMTIFDTTRKTIEELDIRMDYFGDEEDDELEDLAGDGGVLFEMCRLRHLTIWTDFYHDIKWPCRVIAPKLQKASVTPQAMEYLALSAPLLLSESLSELDLQIGEYSYISSPLYDNIGGCTNLTKLCIRVEDFEAADDEFAMSYFLGALATSPLVPLEEFVVTGAHKWDGVGLLELISSRFSTKADGHAVASRRIDTVIVPGLYIPECTRDVLNTLVPTFSCAPFEPEKKEEPSSEQGETDLARNWRIDLFKHGFADTSAPKEGVVDVDFVHNLAYSS